MQDKGDGPEAGAGAGAGAGDAEQGQKASLRMRAHLETKSEFSRGGFFQKSRRRQMSVRAVVRI